MENALGAPDFWGNKTKKTKYYQINTWLLQLSAWEVSYYLIVGDGETKAWVNRGVGQQWVFTMITVQLW